MVTGAAGFIGSHLVEACLRRGWTVTAIDSLTDYYSSKLKLQNITTWVDSSDCEWHEEDLCVANLPALLEGIDIVFHLAAQPGVRASWGDSFDRYTAANVTALQRLLEAAATASISNFVYASSSSVYGTPTRVPTRENVVLRPISPYGATKALGEHLCNVYHESYGLPIVALRYFTVYGPRQRPDMAFHKIIAAGLERREVSIYGDGTQRRDFTYVGDAVEGTMLAGIRGRTGAIYNLGGPEGASLNEAVTLIGELLGAPLRTKHVDRSRGDSRVTAADSRLAAAELGFRPSVRLRCGLESQIAWHRSGRRDMLSAQRV
jgi:nucleoside-diphosphate-sugar epimerase